MSKGFKILGLITINILVISLFSFQLANANEDDIQDGNHGSAYKIIEAKKGDYIEKGAVKNLELMFLRNDGIAIKEPEGNFVEYLVNDGQTVEKGDPLFSYKIPFDQITVVENIIRLEQNRKSYEDDLRKREMEIANNRNLLQSMDQNTIEAQTFKLRITKMEIGYEQFKHQGIKNINTLEETIKELEDKSELKYAYAPYDGIVSTDDRISDDLPINPYMELLRIYDINSAVLAAPAAGINRIWYNQEVSVTQISNRQENTANIYKGKIISVDSVLNNKESTGMIYVMLEDKSLYSSLYRANITVDSVILNDVFVLPLDAVNINNQERYIYYLDDDGVIHKQYITGRDNGLEMWVYDGLSEGQRIIVD